VIEETIQNSAYKLQGAEVGRPTGAVEQEIEPVSEECLEPSAANEQLVVIIILATAPCFGFIFQF